MPRRDRTTAVPKHRPRPVSQRERRFAGIPLREGYARYAILGGVVILFLFVLGLVGYRWYDENIGKPGEVVLRVGDEEFTLRYFADRLGSFAIANPQLTRGFREPALLTKLEEEAVTVELARAAGVDLSSEAVTRYIADELGVEPGGSGSAFDALYRQRLRETGLRESDYRRLSRAALAESALLDIITEEIGDTAETLRLRVIILQSQEAANGVYERIQGGEDMGTIAQTESADVTSRQEDGLLPHTPRRLFPDNIRQALDDAEPGTLLEPVQVQQSWWVIRLEEINPEGSINERDQQQLADLELADRIRAGKANIEIRRSLRDSHVSWAYRNLNVPEGN